MPEKTSFEVTKHNQRHPASDDVFKARSQERGRGAACGRQGHSHESGYAEAIPAFAGKAGLSAQLRRVPGHEADRLEHRDCP